MKLKNKIIQHFFSQDSFDLDSFRQQGSAVK